MPIIKTAFLRCVNNTFKTLAGKVSHSLRKRGTRSLLAQKKEDIQIQMVYLFLRRTRPKRLSSFGQLYGSDVSLEEESRDLCTFGRCLQDGKWRKEQIRQASEDGSNWNEDRHVLLVVNGGTHIHAEPEPERTRKKWTQDEKSPSESLEVREKEPNQSTRSLPPP